MKYQKRNSTRYLYPLYCIHCGAVACECDFFCSQACAEARRNEALAEAAKSDWKLKTFLSFARYCDTNLTGWKRADAA